MPSGSGILVSGKIWFLVSPSGVLYHAQIGRHHVERLDGRLVGHHAGKRRIKRLITAPIVDLLLVDAQFGQIEIPDVFQIVATVAGIHQILHTARDCGQIGINLDVFKNCLCGPCWRNGTTQYQ
jgi:hypothetical protein